ncbi:hypothetical protein CVT24_005057 [Panaeolus cyanescens]|uniref:Uncharacterized protein n=1 Tax=Panaeolus cyanescens TaxID=181874 RepID=A0A409YAX1_9AGAR|nr:hypothetical protein CVT24_005057 [Panaeolus cyanescens]
MESSTSLDLVNSQTIPFDVIPAELLSRIADHLRGPETDPLDLELWNKFACLTKTTRDIARSHLFRCFTIKSKSQPRPMSNSEHIMKFIRLLESPQVLNIAQCIHELSIWFDEQCIESKLHVRLWQAMESHFIGKDRLQVLEIINNADPAIFGTDGTWQMFLKDLLKHAHWLNEVRFFGFEPIMCNLLDSLNTAPNLRVLSFQYSDINYGFGFKHAGQRPPNNANIFKNLESLAIEGTFPPRSSLSFLDQYLQDMELSDLKELSLKLKLDIEIEDIIEDNSRPAQVAQTYLDYLKSKSLVGTSWMPDLHTLTLNFETWAHCDLTGPLSHELAKIYDSFVLPHQHKLKKLAVANMQLVLIDIDSDDLYTGGRDPYAGLMATLKQMRCKNVLETLEINVHIVNMGEANDVPGSWDPEFIEEAWGPLVTVLTSDPRSNPWPKLKQVRLVVKSFMDLQSGTLEQPFDSQLYRNLTNVYERYLCPLSKKFDFSFAIYDQEDKEFFSR